MESQIEGQRARFVWLHNQLEHLYQRLGKDLEKDYCLAYENITAFVVKQVREDFHERIIAINGF